MTAIPLPSDVGHGTLTGKLVTAEQVDAQDSPIDAVPIEGAVVFTPSPSHLRHAGSKQFIIPRPVTATLDEHGAFTVELLATDDPDVEPHGWTYSVTFVLSDVKLDGFHIEVPSGSVQDIMDLAPVTSGNGVFYVRGPKGEPGSTAPHAHLHAAGGSDPVTPASIGAYPATSSTYTSHADDLITPGFYRVSGGNLTEAKGYPPILDASGHLRVERSINSGYIVQTVLGNTADTVWYRTRVADVWQSWTPMGPIIGKGSPEGRITARLGFVYVDQDRTNGAREWVRPSGAASAKTGWQVTEGDTGWRDCNSLTLNGWYCHSQQGMMFRRVGNVVDVAVHGLRAVEATSDTVLSVPQGFIPRLVGASVRPVLHLAESGPVTFRRSLFRGTWDMSPGWLGSDVLYGQFTYTTTDPWPTTLPGTPA